MKRVFQEDGCDLRVILGRLYKKESLKHSKQWGLVQLIVVHLLPHLL